MPGVKQLPVETWTAIITELGAPEDYSTRRDLVNIASVNRAFRVLVDPILWATVVFSGVESFIGFCEMLEFSPRPAQFVRTLHLHKFLAIVGRDNQKIRQLPRLFRLCCQLSCHIHTIHLGDISRIILFIISATFSVQLKRLIIDGDLAEWSRPLARFLSSQLSIVELVIISLDPLLSRFHVPPLCTDISCSFLPKLQLIQVVSWIDFGVWLIPDRPIHTVIVRGPPLAPQYIVDTLDSLPRRSTVKVFDVTVQSFDARILRSISRVFSLERLRLDTRGRTSDAVATSLKEALADLSTSEWTEALSLLPLLSSLSIHFTLSQPPTDLAQFTTLIPDFTVIRKWNETCPDLAHISFSYSFKSGVTQIVRRCVGSKWEETEHANKCIM